jgi:PAS domain S-box-containing protein
VALTSSDHLSLVLAEANARCSTGDAVIATDTRGTIIFWNERAETLFGWRPDEAIGRNVLDVMEELSLGREWKGQFIVQRRDGTPVLVDVIDVPVLDKTGRVIGIVGVSRRDPNRPTPRFVPVIPPG